MQKGLVLVIILLILTMLGFIALFFYIANQGSKLLDSNSTNSKPSSSSSLVLIDSEISNWKTYKNQQYGYSFQYPNGWKQDGLYKGDEDFIQIVDPIDESYIKFNSIELDRGCDYRVDQITPMPVILGNQELEVQDDCVDSFYEIKAINKEELPIVISFSFPPVNNERDIEVIKKILNSVKGLTVSKKK